MIILNCFKKFFVWRGRASRSEYWFFLLFLLVGHILASIINTSLFNGGFYLGAMGTSLLTLNSIFSLITFFPFLSVTIRRLHDTDHSGWWYWITFWPICFFGWKSKKHDLTVPILGLMYSIILLIQIGDKEDNRYGSNPLD